MKRGAWWCRFCLLGGVVCLLLAGVLLALRAGVAARVGQALAPRVAFAEALVARTQTFHLIPDNSAALAASHFAQAQTARAATNLAYAQIELEKALAFGELALNRRGADTYAGVALLREYYADYIDVLLQRNQQEPDGVFAKRAWEAHDRLRWLLSPRPAEAANAVNRTLTVAEVQQELLDDQSLLLEYALGEKQSYLWAITKIGFACFPLPPRAEIEAKAARLVELAGQQPEQMADDPNVEFERLAGELSAVLLQPVAAQMELRRVWVVPEGVLQQVPFSALPVPSQSLENDERLASTPLLVRHEVLSLPAAATGVWLRQQHQAPAQREAVERSIAVIADPVFGKYDERVRSAPAVETPTPANLSAQVLENMLTRLRGFEFGKGVTVPDERAFARLPAAHTEAAAIAAIAPHSAQWLDFAASREVVLSDELARHPLLHFATHGVSDSRSPAGSGLFLSQVNAQGQAVNGFVSNQEISQLHLASELVVLSACETAVSSAQAGKEAARDSVAHSFLRAGAHRVVASLWKVNDAATAELMKRFYQQLYADATMRPAAALRAAQLALARERRWHSPFYWAAFVLQGEG